MNTNMAMLYDDDGNAGSGAFQLRKKLKIGTWNIRSVLRVGKQFVSRDMDWLEVEICGLEEVIFTMIEGHSIVHLGETTRGRIGVGVWIHKKKSGAITGYEPVNNRILVVRLNAKPRCISLILLYRNTL